MATLRSTTAWLGPALRQTNPLSRQQCSSAALALSYRRRYHARPSPPAQLAARSPAPRSHLGTRSFSRPAAARRDHHFDTLKFVQRLKDEGLTEEQSVAMMKILSDVIEERCAPTPT
jgi:hypothetical protein